MSFYTIVAVVIYLFALGYLGFYSFKRTKNAKDYLLGGQKIHPVIMALSYGATFISTSAIVGFGGNAGLFGMSLLWLTFLNIFVGVVIAFIFFGKRTRQMGHNVDAHTFPELLSVRYKSKFIQGFMAAIIFLFMPIYAAGVLKGGVQFISTQFNIDFNIALLFLVIIMALFIAMGGMKFVLYSDAFQAGIMFLGMAFLIFFVYIKLGGITTAHTALTNLMKEPAAQEQTAKMAAAGFQGWTAMPKFNSPYWWTIVSSVVMGVGIGVLAQPQLIVRYMTVKSNRELNRAVVSGSIFILFMTGVAFTVGALTNVFFFQKTGQTSMAAVSNVSDNIIPLFIKTELPQWFGVVFLLTLLSAAMTTLTSQFHVIGTSFGRDLFEKSFKFKGSTILITRLGILAAVIFTAFLAWIGNQMHIEIGLIVQATSIFFGLCAAAFLPAYFGAIYIRKLSRKAALASIITGSVVSFIWIFFIHAKNATTIGLCKLLFGVPHLLANAGAISKLSMVDSVLIATPLSIIVLVVVGLLTKLDIEKEHIDKCFEGIG